MYVCTSVCQVILHGPRRIVDSRRGWPSRRFSESTAGEGTAIAWMSPCWFATSGGTCMHRYIYIYCLCHCRHVFLLLRLVDLRVYWS